MKKNSIKKTIIPYIVLAIILLIVFYAFRLASTKVNQITYADLLKEIALTNGIVIDKILKSPIDGLIEYYSDSYK